MSSKLENLIQRLHDADKWIARAEQQLNEARSRRHMIATVDLPEAMAEFGSSIWKDDRFECKVDFKVFGNLPKDEAARIDAIDYLKEIGEEPIIMANLEAEFTKGNLREARRISRVIQMQDPDGLKDLRVSQTVHHSTLHAMARNRIKENKPLKLEVLGLGGLTIASVKERVK